MVPLLPPTPQLSGNCSRAAAGRRRRGAPPRLGWPTGESSSGGCSGAAAPAAVAAVEQAPQSHREPSRKRSRRVTYGSGGGGGGGAEQPQKQLWAVKHNPKVSADLAVAPKKVKEISSWMQKQSDSGTSKLLLLVGSPGIGKSATVHCLAAELGLEVHEWTESYYDYNMSASSINQHSPLNAFEQFLQQTRTGFASLPQLEPTRRGRKKSRGAIILLDELPHLHGPDAAERFRAILQTHVHQTAVRTVLIYSDTAEGRAQPSDLERLVEPHTLYDASSAAGCKIMQLHAPTKTKFVKVLQQIASAERGRISLLYAEELYDRCGGDLRSAITTLQYELIGDTGTTTSGGRKRLPNERETAPLLRDAKLSSFHALGKLLYAKRQTSGGAAAAATAAGTRSPLAFDPERVVEQSAMEVAGVLQFLEYHSVEFFTDMDDLAAALAYFSDAAVLADHSAAPQSPAAAAISLAGRAVAYANRHPAPRSFRPFSTPKVYDVMRRRRENQGRLERLCAGRSSAASAANRATLAVDVWPYARTIFPRRGGEGSASLHSYLGPAATASSSRANSRPARDDETAASELWREQQAVLQLDDIVDDTDDW